MKEILIDIETYSEVDIGKCGLYRYATDPSTEILLIAWATDEGSGFGETQCADIATGEPFPQELLEAFKDSSVKLIAHNAAFERVNFSCYLNQHYPGQYLKPGNFLSPDNWICTMVMAASLTLPLALKDVGTVLKTSQQKDKEGERLIKLFSVPCKPTKSNGMRTRNLPEHYPADWAKFKYYCVQDVNTEVDIYKRLKKFPMTELEWQHYCTNERINDRGVRIDTELVQEAITWFADKPSSYMVRSMDYGSGQVARALLSERYRRIDNMEIATAVLPLFAGSDQYEVMSCEVTENRLYLKVVNHRLEMEVSKGDIVQAGVMISNSEVGLGAVSIQPLVYRLVCTNGMVVNDMGERRHHVGRQAKAVEDSFALYSDETMEAEDKAFLLKLRDTTMAAIDESRFAQVVGRLQDAMSVPISGKVQDVVQLTAQTYGINSEEQEGILKYLIAGGDLSMYGLSNAVTRASQDVVSYDRATTLEGIGWQVATMEPAQWKQINQ